MTSQFVAIVQNKLWKQILKEGEGNFPKKGDQVSALYRGTLENGTEFDSNQDRDSPFQFTLGQGQVIKGWDSGFASMRKGEKAILKCSPEFAYGKRGSPPKIPANATLLFEVELLDFHAKEADKEELTDEEKLDIAKKLKESGNDHFKAGRNAEAAQDYSKALQNIEDLSNQQAQKLAITLQLNGSMANLRIKNYAKTIELATKVISKQENNPKALFRRGVAYLEVQDFENSRKDLERVLANDPNNNQAKNELIRLKNTEIKVKKTEKQRYKNMFSVGLYDEKVPEPKKVEEPKKIQTESSEDEPVEVEKEQPTNTAKQQKSNDHQSKMEVQNPTQSN